MALFTPTILQSYDVPVRQGNVLQLDAGNPQSYPGTGQTWFDVSGNGNNAALGATIPGYWSSAVGGGYFDWPGSQAYTVVATVTHSNSLNIFNGEFTYEMLFTCDATGTGTADNMGVWSKNEWYIIGQLFNRSVADFGFFSPNFGDVYYGNGQILPKPVVGQWVYAQVVRQGTLLTTYIYTSRLNSATMTGAFNNSNNIIIGRGRNDGSVHYKMDGKLAYISMYNRALTAAERAVNYNYFAKRYGMKTV
jgi:hypothetical protein